MNIEVIQLLLLLTLVKFGMDLADGSVKFENGRFEMMDLKDPNVVFDEANGRFVRRG